MQIKITKNDVKSFFEHRYKLGILEDFLQRPNLNPSGKMIFDVFNTLYIYEVLLLEAENLLQDWTNVINSQASCKGVKTKKCLEYF